MTTPNDPVHPQTATPPPTTDDPVPAYDDISPPLDPSPPSVDDDVSPPWYTWATQDSPTPPTPPFFVAIFQESESELQRLIDLNPKIVNTRDTRDRTPLYCAVAAYKSNIRIVRLLLERGAHVDDWSSEYVPMQPGKKKKRGGWREEYSQKYRTQRTPLMAACARNHIPIARLLLEPPYSADTAFVAPDGQHALRLAVGVGAREIVRMLPTLRAGGLRRLKYRCKPHVEKIKKVVGTVYSVGKFMVVEVPRVLVCEVPKFAYQVGKWFLRALWNTFRDTAEWTFKLPLKLWRLLIWVPGAVWRGVKAAPGLLKTFLTVMLPKVIKGTYDMLREIVVGTVKCIWIILKWILTTTFITIPKLILDGFIFVFQQLKNLGEWLLHLVSSLVSLLHTIYQWLVRNCTWHNVVQGSKAVLRFFFVDIPVGLWRAVKMVYEGFERMLWGIFGCFGCIFIALFRAIMWFPKMLKKIVVECGKIVGSAWKELRVLIDPKAEV